MNPVNQFAARGPYVDGMQYDNWSEKIFRQMRAGGVDAVHVTIAYHETFREMVANIETWNRMFQRSDLQIVSSPADSRSRMPRHIHQPTESDSRACAQFLSELYSMLLRYG